MQKGRGKMVERNVNGKLVLKSLDLEIFLGEMFLKCNTDEEIEWLQEQISETLDVIVDEAKDGSL